METHKFTTQTDVWSFGVVLGEIFNDGATPYSGLDNLVVMTRVMSGRPDEKPATCPECIWENVISPCWNYDPAQRPSFAKLAERLESFDGGASTGVSTLQIGVATSSEHKDAGSNAGVGAGAGADINYVVQGSEAEREEQKRNSQMMYDTPEGGGGALADYVVQGSAAERNTLKQESQMMYAISDGAGAGASSSTYGSAPLAAAQSSTYNRLSVVSARSASPEQSMYNRLSTASSIRPTPEQQPENYSRLTPRPPANVVVNPAFEHKQLVAQNNYEYAEHTPQGKPTPSGGGDGASNGIHAAAAQSGGDSGAYEYSKHQPQGKPTPNSVDGGRNGGISAAVQSGSGGAASEYSEHQPQGKPAPNGEDDGGGGGAYEYSKHQLTGRPTTAAPTEVEHSAEGETHRNCLYESSDAIPVPSKGDDNALGGGSSGGDHEEAGSEDGTRRNTLYESSDAIPVPKPTTGSTIEPATAAKKHAERNENALVSGSGSVVRESGGSNPAPALAASEAVGGGSSVESTPPDIVARALWDAESNGEKKVLSAPRAGILLAKSGLAKNALRRIWGQAKAGSSTSKATMSEDEFVKAYMLVVEAGGRFDSADIQEALGNAGAGRRSPDYEDVDPVTRMLQSSTDAVENSEV